MRALQQAFRRHSSLGSSSGTNGSGQKATPHLLASQLSSDSIGRGGLPPPAALPPRPSPDKTVAARELCETYSISQSEATQVVTNATSACHRACDCEPATLDDGTLSDESDTISDLTALSAAYKSGIKTEETSGDRLEEVTKEQSQEATTTTSSKTSKTKKKPKSIFRRTLKYTKPQLSFGRCGSSSKTAKVKNAGGIHEPPSSPPQKFQADIGASLGTSMDGQASHQQQQHVGSPKTPKTVASLDYSTDDDKGPTPKVINKEKVNHGDGEWNRVEAHTPPGNESRPKESMSTPSAPTRPSSDSSTSQSSAYSGDTFSTLTTKSSTDPSIKSAPASACINKATSADESQPHHHRRAKSQEMDDLFATILSITDAPGKDIEDMLKANKSVQSQARASRTRRKKQVSNLSAIANMSFVEHNERARARESGGALVPRFESYARAETKAEQQDPRMALQLPQLPMVPGDRHHRRLPSREEQMLAAPRMPLFPQSKQQGYHRNKSIDSIERGRQSPHVQFREERLCSFYSNGDNANDCGRQESLDLFGDGHVNTEERREEERLESEIYQTLLSMEAFDVKVADIDDLSANNELARG